MFLNKVLHPGRFDGEREQDLCIGLTCQKETQLFGRLFSPDQNFGNGVRCFLIKDHFAVIAHGGLTEQQSPHRHGHGVAEVDYGLIGVIVLDLAQEAVYSLHHVETGLALGKAMGEIVAGGKVGISGGHFGDGESFALSEVDLGEVGSDMERCLKLIGPRVR